MRAVRTVLPHRVCKLSMEKKCSGVSIAVTYGSPNKNPHIFGAPANESQAATAVLHRYDFSGSKPLRAPIVEWTAAAVVNRYRGV